MSNSIVIKEPKRAVDKPKSSQTSGLNNIEKALKDNNQLLKKNIDAIQKMADSVVESQKSSKTVDRELNSLREKLIELRKQKAEEYSSNDRQSSESSSQTSSSSSSKARSDNYQYRTKQAVGSLVDKASTPGAAFSTATSTGLAIATGGIVNPVIIKALGLDTLITSVLRDTLHIAGKAISLPFKAAGKIGGLALSGIGELFGGSGQQKTAGTTSSNAKATKDAKLLKKLDTIISLLGGTVGSVTKDVTKKGKGIFSKIIGILGAGLRFVASHLKGLILGGLAVWGATKLYKHWEKIKNDVEENGWKGAFEKWGKEIKDWFLKTELGQKTKEYIDGWKTDIDERGVAGAITKRVTKFVDDLAQDSNLSQKSKDDIHQWTTDIETKGLLKTIGDRTDQAVRDFVNNSNLSNDAKKNINTFITNFENEGLLEATRKLIGDLTRNFLQKKNISPAIKTHIDFLIQKFEQEGILGMLTDAWTTSVEETVTIMREFWENITWSFTERINRFKRIYNEETKKDPSIWGKTKALVKATDSLTDAIDTHEEHNNINAKALRERTGLSVNDRITTYEESSGKKRMFIDAFNNSFTGDSLVNYLKDSNKLNNSEDIQSQINLMNKLRSETDVKARQEMYDYVIARLIKLQASNFETVRNAEKIKQDYKTLEHQSPVKVENSTQLNVQDYPSPADSSFTITNNGETTTISSNDKIDPSKPSKQELLFDILQEIKQQSVNKQVIINEANQTSATPFSNSDFVNVF